MKDLDLYGEIWNGWTRQQRMKILRKVLSVNWTVAGLTWNKVEEKDRMPLAEAMYETF